MRTSAASPLASSDRLQDVADSTTSELDGCGLDFFSGFALGSILKLTTIAVDRYIARHPNRLWRKTARPPLNLLRRPHAHYACVEPSGPTSSHESIPIVSATHHLASRCSGADSVHLSDRGLIPLPSHLTIPIYWETVRGRLRVLVRTKHQNLY